MENRIYYAVVSLDEFENLICNSVLDTFQTRYGNEYILLQSYDETLLGKIWTGSEWVDNPNYVLPEVQPEIFE